MPNVLVGQLYLVASFFGAYNVLMLECYPCARHVVVTVSVIGPRAVEPARK